ncbi:InlB B-repeat-containing protein, partial [Lactococcus sp. dk322]|uniref:InlB B-repeat-containing protein n=1 Tax=Lactococcus sp. dk322 TaxID=2603290 RepID=UPI0011C98C88
MKKRTTLVALGIILSSQILPVMAHANDISQATNNSADAPPTTSVVEESNTSNTVESIAASGEETTEASTSTNSSEEQKKSEAEAQGNPIVLSEADASENAVSASISTQSSYQTYTNPATGTTPSDLSIFVNISSSTAGLDGVKVEVPYDGFMPSVSKENFSSFEMTDPIFTYIENTDTPGSSSIIDHYENDTQNNKIIIHLKKTTTTVETAQLKFVFNSDYMGKIPEGQIIWDDLKAVVKSNDDSIISSSTPTQIKTDAINGLKPVSTGSSSYTSGKYLWNAFFYNDYRQFSLLDENKNNRLYLELPETAEIDSSSFIDNSEKITSVDDPNIPKGYVRYYKKVTDTSATFGQWNAGGNFNSAYSQISLNITPNTGDAPFYLKTGMITTKINGKETEETSTTNVSYKAPTEFNLGLGANRHAVTGSTKSSIISSDRNNVTSAIGVLSMSPGFSNANNLRNLGTSSVTGVEATVYQKSTTSAKANYNSVTVQSETETADTPEDYYKVKFVIKNAKDSTAEPRIEYSEAQQGTFSVSRPSLSDGEFVDSFSVVPFGLDGKSEGTFSPGNSICFRYNVRNWSDLTWPDGTAIPQNTVFGIVSGGKISYNDNDGVAQIKHQADNTVTYTPRNTTQVNANIVSSGANGLVPGDSVSYEIQGYNRVDALSSFNSPRVTVAIPKELELVDPFDNKDFVDKKNNQTYTGAVSVDLINSDSKYNYYQFTAEGMEVYKNDAAVSFAIPLNFKVAAGSLAGSYNIGAVAISSSTDVPLIQYNTATNNLSDSMANAMGLDNSKTSSYSSTTTGNTPISIASSIKLESNTSSRSSNSGAWSDVTLFAVEPGATPQMKASISNTGNVSFDNARLYNILPTDGDSRGSTGQVDFDGLENSSGTVYYTTKAISDLPSYNSVDLQSWTSETLASYGFTTSKPTSGATAIYIDFGSQKISPNSSLDTILNFNIPSDSNSKAVNQFAYSAKEAGGSVELKGISDLVTFSTESVSFLFDQNLPSVLVDGVEKAEGMPNDQSVLLDTSGKGTITIPNSTPTLPGYTFDSWENAKDKDDKVKPGDTISVNNTTDKQVSYKAIWKANPVSVKFNSNHGETPTSQTVTFNFGSSLDLSKVTSPVRSGYTFVEWNTKADGTGDSVSESTVVNFVAEKTYYAVWAANSYNVKFDANGGKGSMDPMGMTYDQSKALTANTMTKDGYTFQGWATSATGAVVYKDKAEVKNLATSGDVTLYAVWAANSYNVKFDANGGKGSMDPMGMTYDQ